MHKIRILLFFFFFSILLFYRTRRYFPYRVFQEWQEESANTIITYVMILTAMMFNIFIFCFIGELVTDQVK